MPTKREREYYAQGFNDGQLHAERQLGRGAREDIYVSEYAVDTVKPRQRPRRDFFGEPTNPKYKKKRKLSAWNKYVKANSKKPRFRYRNGKLNLKKMAIAFRKTPAGKKKRR